ncbi:CidA/LrgA family protein [Intestinibacter sp.]|uniref:CidA/LrgA family protein n=1 Tax=Intestinibacter sp. TaxID=1965304 RepID=UPI002A75582E|nr:CidA/LrgA family protein [Intestinibacter sp.]MDY2735564.1 CidA/LrgA family protein [Intestinibacter sp.]
MKFFNQIGILLGIWAAGEFISQLIKNVINIPGSIIGMIILFVLLESKILDESKIKDLADFFLGNMSLFFIPAGVSLIESLGLIKENAVLLLSCILIINVAVMIVSGRSVDLMIKLKEKKEKKEKKEAEEVA